MSTAEFISFVGGSQRSDNDNRDRDVRPRAKLGNFVHGQLKQNKVEFNNFHIYELPKDNKKQIMVAETDSMTYVGKNYEKDSYNNDCQRTYLGAYDPKTGKMEVLDLDIFRFKPYFTEMEEKKDKEDKAEVSYIDQNDVLTSAFGSKRKRRAMETRKKNLVSEDTLKKVLDSTVREGMEEAKEKRQKLDELIKAEDFLTFILPSHNKDADKAMDIFKMTDIITEDEMEVLTEPSQELFDSTPETIKQWDEENKYSLLLIKHLSSLTKKEDARREKCKHLWYLHCLITLCTIPAKHIRNKKFPLPQEWSGPLKMKLLDKFTGPAATNPSASKKDKEYRSYTQRYEDRLLSYTLIMCMILDDFGMSLGEVAHSTKVSKRRLVTHGRMIGFTVSNANKTNTSATLKAPLRIVKKKPPMLKKKF